MFASGIILNLLAKMAGETGHKLNPGVQRWLEGYFSGLDKSNVHDSRPPLAGVIGFKLNANLKKYLTGRPHFTIAHHITLVLFHKTVWKYLSGQPERRQ